MPALFKNKNHTKNRTVKSLQFLTIVSISLSIFLCGCKEQETEAPVEITIVSGWGGTFRSHEVMREIYEEFDRQNPDIKLNCVPYSDNTIAVEKAIDMMAVGNAPDIVSTNGLSSYLEYAVNCEEAMDLMPYLEADKEWKEQIHPAVFETWLTKDGALYTIPDALEVAGYWYNEAYLLQAGITDEHGEVQIPKTWTEFMGMLEKLQEWTKQEQKDIHVAILEEDQLKNSFFLARLAGGSPEGLEAVLGAKQISAKELLYGTVNDMKQLSAYSEVAKNIEDARQKFADGKSVIYFSGVWEVDELIQSSYKDQIRYANYPTYNGKSLSYVSASSGYVITKQTNEKKAEACIRFMKYILSEEVQERIAVMTSQAPSNQKIENELIARENPMLGQSLNEAYSADIQIPTIYSVWNESQIEAIRDMIQ